VDGNNIPVIPRTINELIESAGLLRIAHDHKATLLASCEIALGKRNETVAALQAENAKLKKVADIAALLFDNQDINAHWYNLEDSLIEAGYDI